MSSEGHVQDMINRSRYNNSIKKSALKEPECLQLR